MQTHFHEIYIFNSSPNLTQYRLILWTLTVIGQVAYWKDVCFGAGEFQIRKPIPLDIRRVLGLLLVKSNTWRVKHPRPGEVLKIKLTRLWPIPQGTRPENGTDESWCVAEVWRGGASSGDVLIIRPQLEMMRSVRK
ncbi:hypothetical protein AVEN_148306-1 [Araneus ventricosus]|uniref:Uncharacterized protein n=1 Tax=Araneus ventricosus TaxID=182803 RepID=A0A4Y2TPF8_ARAVE|nr:hypothetical protein AVEN_148306-1 [Araneus ventricosus]